MSEVIWLIAESDEDVDVFRQILNQKGIQVRVEKVGVGAVRGISKLANQLPKLIGQARANKRYRTHHCIVVLYDRDVLLTNRKDHDHIEQICGREGAIYLIADDKIEAWMLADKGLCKFLRRNIKARNWDGYSNVKDKLEENLRKKNMTYSGRDRQKVIAHLDGTGDIYSPSMQTSLSTLRARECL